MCERRKSVPDTQIWQSEPLAEQEPHNRQGCTRETRLAAGGWFEERQAGEAGAETVSERRTWCTLQGAGCPPSLQGLVETLRLWQGDFPVFILRLRRKQSLGASRGRKMVNWRTLDSGFRHSCWAWISASSGAKDTEKEGHAPVTGCADPTVKRARARGEERGHPLAVLLRCRGAVTCTSTSHLVGQENLKVREWSQDEADFDEEAKLPSVYKVWRSWHTDFAFMPRSSHTRIRQTTSGWKIRSKEETDVEATFLCHPREEKSPSGITDITKRLLYPKILYLISSCPEGVWIEHRNRSPKLNISQI